MVVFVFVAPAGRTLSFDSEPGRVKLDRSIDRSVYTYIRTYIHNDI